MKILYVTTIGGTMTFFKSLIKELIDERDMVDIATNETDSRVPEYYYKWGCNVYPISTSREPFSTGNIRAIKDIRKLAKDYDVVHCHTPIAAMATRLACITLRKKGLKVIYTAHGFHFYKGSPLINWIIYYPIEWVCAYLTDVLITINKEDYLLAQVHMHAKKVEYVQGVGIDIDKFRNTIVDREKKRKELGIAKDAFLLLSVGELNKNKNHQIVIRALANIENRNIHYAIAGQGELEEYLLNLAKELGVEDRVHLLGFREDVAELYKTADVYILPSLREGLNVSLMEAMVSGTRCVASYIRGNEDFLSYNVILVNSFEEYVNQIEKLANEQNKAISCFSSNIAESINQTRINKRIHELYYA